MTSKILKLGTRRSLLAWAQSSWVAREIEAANPGLKIELVGIETRGDVIQDIPLSQVTGKEFFVAEIDQALAGGRVDLTVHSMKDLSLERPAELRLAALPKRENPRDVILFSPNVLKKIAQGQALRIGTSAPRRLENVPGFLEKALPHLAGQPRVKFIEIRGNVNTRAGRLHESVDSPTQLDGVVLSFAGLIRLWRDEKARIELTKLLEGVRWMVLPLRENPTAPAQGALAIECRRADEETYNHVHKIHDSESEKHVAVERKILAEWGGGCHQRFGATSIAHTHLGSLFFIRGTKQDGTFADELRWSQPERRPLAKATVSRVWDGSQHTGQYSREGSQRISVDGSTFVAHSRAAEAAEFSGQARIWTSGVKSWFALAERGLWVEGCAESLGFDHALSILSEPVLGHPSFQDWTVLTHDQAADGWKSGKVIATYHVETGLTEAETDSLRSASDIYWSSGSQFDQVGALAQGDARHSCGPGKTYGHLKACGVRSIKIFPSAEEWRKWIKTSHSGV